MIHGVRMRALIAFLIVVSFAAPAAAQDWRDAELGQGIREGVATREHIWLLGSTGKVVRFVRRTGERETVAENVRDIAVDDGRLWALILADDTASYSLRDLRGPDQPSGQQAARAHRLYLHPAETSEGEAIGLLVWPGSDRPAVLARRALVTPTEEGWKRWRLAATLGPGGRIATPDGRSVFVGYNLGEWGGGLRRIEVSTGAVAFVMEAGDDLCGGRINPACDPVVGVFADRDQPDCVIVGAGISHMGLSRGDVYRVCGATITSLFSTPAPREPDMWMMSPQPWPLHGLFETSDGWVGVSRDRYFRSRGGAVEEHPMPAFKDWAGLKLSDEQEGVLFLVSACCWGSTANPTLYSTLVMPILP